MSAHMPRCPWGSVCEDCYRDSPPTFATTYDTRTPESEVEALRSALASAEARVKEARRAAEKWTEIANQRAEQVAIERSRTRRAVEAALAKAAEVHPEEITSISPDEILRGLKDE